MRTDDLIEALVADRASRALRPPAAIGLAAIAGAVIAGTVFMAVMSYRPDIWQAAGTFRFLFKFVFTLTLAASAISLTLIASRPEAVPGRRLWLVALAPAMLILAVAAELAVMPSSSWLTRLLGTNALVCLTWIPLLSIAPMLAFLAALKHGAPANPGLAGALAGLGSASIAATLYASHCTDDSPLFVVVWYSLAIGLVTLVGYLAGRLWLKW